MSDKVLQLAVRGKWFELIKSGEKTEEYRLRNDYWIKRIRGKSFSKVVITHGYPKKDDLSKRLEFYWRGATVKTICSDEFGSKKEVVFAIDLSGLIST